jgi:hypothetical protein
VYEANPFLTAFNSVLAKAAVEAEERALADVRAALDHALDTLRSVEQQAVTARIEARERAIAAIEAWKASEIARIEHEADRRLSDVQASYEADVARIRAEYEAKRQEWEAQVAGYEAETAAFVESLRAAADANVVAQLLANVPRPPKLTFGLADVDADPSSVSNEPSEDRNGSEFAIEVSDVGVPSARSTLLFDGSVSDRAATIEVASDAEPTAQSNMSDAAASDSDEAESKSVAVQADDGPLSSILDAAAVTDDDGWTTPTYPTDAREAPDAQSALGTTDVAVDQIGDGAFPPTLREQTTRGEPEIEEARSSDDTNGSSSDQSGRPGLLDRILHRPQMSKTTLVVTGIEDGVVMGRFKQRLARIPGIVHVGFAQRGDDVVCVITHEDQTDIEAAIASLSEFHPSLKDQNGRRTLTLSAAAATDR